MNLLDNIIRTLQKPFPEAKNRLFYYKYLALLSVFVAFFLYIFEPFGLGTIESHQFLVCLGFGSMTFVGGAIYDLSMGTLFRILGKGKTWTYGKWILNNLGIVLFISMANFMFSRLVLFGFIDWELFPIMLYSTFMIGALPVVLVGRMTLLSQERKYQGIAQEINQKPLSSPTISHAKEVSLFGISASQIKYVEALQNYVKIGYVNAEGKLKEQTERATLKSLLEQVEGSAIVKCHRSFLVNRESIISTAGNAQGLLLSLSDCEKIIPVSRNWVAVFRES